MHLAAQTPETAAQPDSGKHFLWKATLDGHTAWLLGSVHVASESMYPLAPAIEAALRAKLVDELGVKPKFAFGPARVAVTGSRVSPPLFESMEVLGRESTLARLARLAERL